MKVNVIDKSETINLDIHWACGRIDCDCDEQYESFRDDQIREVASEVEAEMAYEQECY